MSAFLQTYSLNLAAALLSGAGAGLLGVFVLGLRLPFLTVCATHAALAGAVLGALLGWPATPAAFAGALAFALTLGALLRRHDMEPNAALGALFSLLLGLTFFGMAWYSGPTAAMLELLWGSLVYVTRAQLLTLLVVSAALLAFVLVFHKELPLLLFSRRLAALLLPEALLFTALLVLIAGVVSVNLEIVGGLLLYGLIANPALAARRIARRYPTLLAASAALGATSALGGFLAAWALDLPAGACIVLLSALVAALAQLIPNQPKIEETDHATD